MFYQKEFYTDPARPETGAYRRGILREDMCRAIWLVIGNYDEELPLQILAMPWRDQVKFFKLHAKIKSGTVLEIGYGTGECMLALREIGFKVWGIDASPAARDVARETWAEWADIPAFKVPAYIGSAVLAGLEWFDTIVMVETAEHVSQVELDYVFKLCRKRNARCIITNELWPIAVNDYDHITRMDDDVVREWFAKDLFLYHQDGYMAVQL